MPSLRAVPYKRLSSEGEGEGLVLTTSQVIDMEESSASVSLHEVDNAVSSCQDAVLSLPRSHPLRASSVESLAMTLLARCKLSGQQDDLEQSTLYLTEMIFLPLTRNAGCSQNIVQIFFLITCALIRRADESRQLEGVACSIMYLRYLRQQSFEAFNVSRCHVTEFLVHALAIRVRLEAGDVIGDIEEMAVLCLELLDSDTSANSLADCIAAVVEAVCGQLASLFKGQEPPEKVIEFLREVNRRSPDLDMLSVTLAFSLFIRFQIRRLNDDYEEAMAILENVIASRTPGDQPSEAQERALGLIAALAITRSTMFGEPEYLAQAIHRVRTFVNKASLQDPARPIFTLVLAGLEEGRFHDFGVTGGLQDTRPSASEFFGRPSFRELCVSLTNSSGSQSFPAKMKNQHKLALLSASDITDVAEMEEAIEYCRLLLASSHSDGELAAFAHMTLGNLLQNASSLTNKIEYLDEAITLLRGEINIPYLRPVQFPVIGTLITCLSIRFNLLHLGGVLNEIMQLYSVAVNDKCAPTPDRFLLSCDWARFARNFGHHCTSTAYNCAISLMQESLTFAPTIHTQHFRLIAKRDNYEKLPLEYASHQIHTGQLEQAIETLERGRALLWSEMRGLRTSIEKLRVADSHLANKFVAVNRDLEMLTLTVLPVSNDGGSDDSSPEGMDPFGHLVLRQRKLLDERDKLILQIQAKPGFETFLKTPSFNNLRSAAVRGPVIMINHCEWRSDILILLHNSPPSLISTTNDFYGHANHLRDQLLGARRKGLESNEYEETLCSVLKGLYELVGRPLIQRLNEFCVPEQSRVWLCPTSAFCSLPLHAMGPIPSDGGPKQYFLDLYIPSYTPTLSALIESNKADPQTPEKPSILLVAQPDASIKEGLEEMQHVRAARTQVTTLIAARATPATVLERLRDHRFAHFVCHGTLEPGKPFEASFELYDKRRLSLLDIVRSRLAHAEFAFLSACHTAELTDESIADEALHLTAAMQFCGFRSVVGTMWAMADTDGPDLARNFYRSVFSSDSSDGVGGRRQGVVVVVRHYERTAGALRDAVKRLRRKRGITLERWVNFVHYGA